MKMNILYVSSDKTDPDVMCPGSIVCLAMAEKIPDSIISIQNCDILKQKKKLPPWLNGTPILINEEEQVPYRGRDAMKQMHILAESIPTPYVEETEVINTRRKDPVRENPDIIDDRMANDSTAPQNDSDPFHIDVATDAVIEPASGKVTEQDLQKYMEQRNQSLASQQPKQQS